MKLALQIPLWWCLSSTVSASETAPTLHDDFNAHTMTALAHISHYPGTPPGPKGTLALQSSGGTLTIFGVITGLTPSSRGGWHIHTGFSCDSADLVDVGVAHYFPGMTADPWLGGM